MFKYSTLFFALISLVFVLGSEAQPNSPVRTPAEFEPVQAVIIKWDFGMYDALNGFLIENIQDAGATAIVLVDDDIFRLGVNAYIRAGKIRSDRLIVFTLPTTSIWTRDYGPTSVFHGSNGELAMIDWLFDYPGHKNDDDLPKKISEAFGYNQFQLEKGKNRVVLAGGDFVTDGFGTAFSSSAVRKENPGRFKRVKKLLDSHMGISSYVLLEQLVFGPDNHIDMYMKLLDEETILVGQYDSDSLGDEIIEENVEYLRTLDSCYGKPYRIVRIPMPGNTIHQDFRTYTNSLIVNNYVLVPLYGIDKDEIALQIYRDAMPGYNVVGFDCSDIIALRGAIHCMTHEIHKDRVVRIAHARNSESVSPGDTVRISAKCWSQELVNEALVHVLLPGEEDYEIYPMQFYDGVWEAEFIATMPGTAKYFISAYTENISGYKPQNARFGGFLSLRIEDDDHNASPSETRDVFVPDRNNEVVSEAYPISSIK